MCWHPDQSKIQFKHRILLKLLELASKIESLYIYIYIVKNRLNLPDISEEGLSTLTLTLNMHLAHFVFTEQLQSIYTLNSEQGLSSLLCCS